MESIRDGLFNLWLLERASGICFFDQSFSEGLSPDILDNPCLIGGFFTAIEHFYKQLTDQEIEFIQLENVRFYFHGTDKVLFAFAVDNRVKSFTVESFIKDIQERFERKYESMLLKDGKLNEVGKFKDFANDVEDLVGKKSTSVNFMNDRDDFIVFKYEMAKSELSHLRVMLQDQERRINSPRERETVSPLLGYKLLKTLGTSYCKDGGDDSLDNAPRDQLPVKHKKN